MAVKTQRGLELPEGAVKLSKDEALILQKKFITDWPSELEVFSLKHAPLLCGASTLLSGTIAFLFYKKLFNVSPGLSLVSYGPSIIIPSISSAVMTDRIITNKNLLMQMSCPLCTQLKFTAFQLYNSVLSPIVLSFVFCHYFGQDLKAFKSDGPLFKSKDFWKTPLKLSEKGFSKFQFIAVFQLGFSFLLPYVQNMQLSNIMKKYEQSTHDEELKDDYFV